MRLVNTHYRSLISAVSRTLKKPFEHLLNITVISIIIAILGSIFVITKNFNKWEQSNLTHPQIMVYLKPDTSQDDLLKLETTINQFNQNIVKNYQFISKQKGLQDLQNNAQLKAIASDVISDNTNPLPDILIVTTNTSNSNLLTHLTEKIKNMEMVNQVEMDNNYVNKLNDLLNFIKNILVFLQFLFIIVFTLVVYNMIRLEMFLCQDEITVSRLIGASDSFILLPLAYYAVLQVILALGIAYFLVNLFINFIINAAIS